MTCHVCGCTETMPCQGGCYWYQPDICSVCARLITAMGWFISESGRPTPEAVLRAFRVIDEAPVVAVVAQ